MKKLHNKIKDIIADLEDTHQKILLGFDGFLIAVHLLILVENIAHFGLTLSTKGVITDFILPVLIIAILGYILTITLKIRAKNQAE